MIPGKKYSPEDVVKAAWRRRWWMVGTAVLVSVAAAVLATRMTVSYRSDALLQVVSRSPSDEYLRPGSVPQADDRTTPESRLIAMGREVMTRPRLERVVVDLALYQQLRRERPMPEVVDRLRRDVVFAPVDRDTFRLGYSGASAEQARQVTERLARLFTDEDAIERANAATARRQFLDAQLEEARTRLSEQEKRLEAYRLQYGSELPAQSDVNLRSQAEAERQLQLLVEANERDRNQVLYLQRQRDQVTFDEPMTVPATAATDPDWPATAGGNAADRLEAARATLKAQMLRMTEDHPDVAHTKVLIAELEKEAEAERADGGLRSARPRTAAEAQKRNRQQDLQAQIELLNRQIASHQADERRLRAEVGTYRGRLAVAPRRESELNALTRDNETQKRLYAELLARRDEAALAASLEQQAIGRRFRVLEQPRLPLYPETPSRSLIVLLGFVVGLLLGGVLAALVEYRDSSFRTDIDVTSALGVPVLATIPVLDECRSGLRSQGWRIRTHA